MCVITTSIKTQRYLESLIILISFLGLSASTPAASNPESDFKLAGSCGERITDTAFSGKIAYFAQGSKVRIVDTEHPTGPMLVGKLDLEDEVDHLVICGAALYAVSNTDSGCSIDIIDISDPKRPHVKSNLPIKDEEKIYIKIIGSVLWVVGGAHHGHISSAYDISNPLNPVKRPVKEDGKDASIGQIKYTLAKGSDIQLLDLTKPAESARVGILKFEGWVDGIIAKGPGLYVVTKAEGGCTLHIIDASDPKHPKIVRTIAFKDELKINLSITDSVLWVWEGGRWPLLLAAYDLSTPLNPVAHPTIKPEQEPVENNDAEVKLTELVRPSWIPEFTFIEGVQTSGNIAYLADESFGLRVLDISDPKECRLLGSVSNEGGAKFIVRSESTICLAGSKPVLTLVDVSKPTSPTICGTLMMPTDIHSLAISGKTVYAACGMELRIIDISDPQAPKIIATYTTANECKDVIVSGHLALIAAKTVDIIDVSDPSHPKAIKANLDVGLEAESLLLHHKEIFAFGWFSGSSGSNQPSIIDISDPASPKVREHAFEIESEGGLSSSETIDDSLMYSASFNRIGPYGIYHAGSIKIYDLTHTPTPESVGSIIPPYAPAHVFIRGDKMFVSGATGGLMLYQRSGTTGKTTK